MAGNIVVAAILDEAVERRGNKRPTVLVRAAQGAPVSVILYATTGGKKKAEIFGRFERYGRDYALPIAAVYFASDDDRRRAGFECHSLAFVNPHLVSSVVSA